MTIFRKIVHADFYGYLDVNFVVSVFGPNKHHQFFDFSDISSAEGDS